MRILQVCPYDLARPGGVQRHILDLSRALCAAGHEVTVIAPTAPGSGHVHNSHMSQDAFAVLPLGTFRTCSMHGTRFEVSWASRAQLHALLAQHHVNRFDVVHFHTPWTPFMSWQVFRRMCPRVARRVATFHDTPPPTITGRITRGTFKWLSRWLSMRLDVIIAVSDSPALHLRPRAACALVLLPPCIDLSTYRALPAPVRPGVAMRVLFVGRLEPRKGILLLIKAFAQVQQRHVNSQLVICGDGDQDIAARKLVQALGIASSVIFTGALAEPAKQKLFDEADIFCAPSPYGESYGLVIAEAMAAGLPVVAAANSGYRTLLAGDGAVGLVPPGDSRALAERLLAFTESPELRQRLSAWGRAQAGHSDVNSRLTEFTAVYEATPGLSGKS